MMPGVGEEGALVGEEDVEGHHGGCSKWERRVLGVRAVVAGAAERGMLTLTGTHGKTCPLAAAVQEQLRLMVVPQLLPGNVKLRVLVPSPRGSLCHSLPLLLYSTECPAVEGRAGHGRGVQSGSP